MQQTVNVFVPERLVIMEVVLGTCVLAQVLVKGIDKLASRFPKVNESTSSPEDHLHSPIGTSLESEVSSDDVLRITETPPVAEAPEGSIQALQAQLKKLRMEAKELSSPDTFVQYARVMREANKVEKELNEKRGMRFIFSSSVFPKSTSVDVCSVKFTDTKIFFPNYLHQPYSVRGTT